MSIQVCWDNEDRSIIRLDFEVRWSIFDLKRKLRACMAMMRSVDHSVGIIFDLSQFSGTPAQTLGDALDLLLHMPPNRGVLVLVSRDILSLESMNSVFLHYQERDLRILPVQSLEQAHNLLRHEHRMKVSGERDVPAGLPTGQY